MGNKFINQETESHIEAKNQKGDRFDMRIKMDAGDPGWHKAYDYTRKTSKVSSFLSPDSRVTTPSTYLEGSGSSLAHTVSQGQAGPSRPSRAITYQPLPIEQMTIEDHGGEESRHGSSSHGRHGRSSHKSTTGGSHRSSRQRASVNSEEHPQSSHHSHRERSRRHSRSVEDDCFCCVVM